MTYEIKLSTAQIQQTPALSHTWFDCCRHASCTSRNPLLIFHLGFVIAREVGPAGSHHPLQCQDSSRQAAGAGGQGCSLQSRICPCAKQDLCFTGTHFRRSVAEGLSAAEVPRVSCSACLALYCVVPGINLLQAQKRSEQDPHKQLEKLLSAWGWY